MDRPNYEERKDGEVTIVTWKEYDQQTQIMKDCEAVLSEDEINIFKGTCFAISSKPQSFFFAKD